MLSSLGAQAVRQSNTRNIIDTSFLLFIIDFSTFYFNTQKSTSKKKCLSSQQIQINVSLVYLIFDSAKTPPYPRRLLCAEIYGRSPGFKSLPYTAFPSLNRQWLFDIRLLVTVAGPLRICTGFPFKAIEKQLPP